MNNIAIIAGTAALIAFVLWAGVVADTLIGLLELGK